MIIYLDRLLSVFHVAPGQLILSQSQLASFTGLLFSHVLEAMGIKDVNGGDFRSR